MTLNVIVAFSDVVAFVIPLVAMLTSSPMILAQRTPLEF
jgi:hypothetical protein